MNTITYDYQRLFRCIVVKFRQKNINVWKDASMYETVLCAYYEEAGAESVNISVVLIYNKSFTDRNYFQYRRIC